jgi:hypothetical protein
MKYSIHSHRNGKELLETQHREIWEELQKVLDEITEEDLIKQFPLSKNKMSLSSAINNLIKERLSSKEWVPEAPIFQDPEYSQKRETIWRLDFAKGPISIEVSFNHGEALAWNLTKPTLASEMNHVRKAIQTKVGVIILVKEGMKSAGAFDGAVGSYEKAIRYLKPMHTLLTVPTVLIGLKAPKTFEVEKEMRNGRNVGVIKLNDT